jgi:hypothetical protein
MLISDRRGVSTMFIVRAKGLGELKKYRMTSWRMIEPATFRLVAIVSQSTMLPLQYSLTTSKSVVRVRERNIPTERPPFDGEVSANFIG